MDVTIWTFRNKKRVDYLLPRFYYVEDEKSLLKLVDNLMQIDACFYPSELPFPSWLELKSGFGPELILVTKEHIEKEISTLEERISKIKKTLTR